MSWVLLLLLRFAETNLGHWIWVWRRILSWVHVHLLSLPITLTLLSLLPCMDFSSKYSQAHNSQWEREKKKKRETNARSLTLSLLNLACSSHITSNNDLMISSNYTSFSQFSTTQLRWWALSFYSIVNQKATNHFSSSLWIIDWFLLSLQVWAFLLDFLIWPGCQSSLGVFCFISIWLVLVWWDRESPDFTEFCDRIWSLWLAVIFISYLTNWIISL